MLIKGRRDMILNITKDTGFEENSLINYTCNPYYNRVGKQYIYCKDGQWETSIPKCVLTEKICRKKPPMKIINAQMVELKSTLVKNEYAFPYITNDIRFYSIASYTCPGNKFSDSSLVKYKTIKGHQIGYVDYACIGKDKWEDVVCG